MAMRLHYLENNDGHHRGQQSSFPAGCSKILREHRRDLKMSVV